MSLSTDGFKIAHTADWHIGYSAGRSTDARGINLRVLDGYKALGRVVHGILEEHPDAVVVSGDVFHTPTPTPRDILTVRTALWKFWENEIPVYVLAGNHDASDLERDIAASKVIDDPWRKIYSTAKPADSFELTDGLVLHMASHHRYEQQKGTFGAMKRTPGCVNLFATHGGLTNPVTNLVLKTPQSPREIIIPSELLEIWDFVLLGHIHERQQVDEKTYYAGSLLRRGFADKEGARGWILHTISPDGTSRVEYKDIPQRPQYDFPVLNLATKEYDDPTGVILENIKTALNESADSPILRQRVVIGSAGLTSINMRAINQAAESAFSFQVSPIKESSPLGSVGADVPEATGEENLTDLASFVHEHLVSSYETWSNEDKNVKEVAATAIRKAQDAILEKLDS